MLPVIPTIPTQREKLPQNTAQKNCSEALFVPRTKELHTIHLSKPITQNKKGTTRTLCTCSISMTIIASQGHLLQMR